MIDRFKRFLSGSELALMTQMDVRLHADQETMTAMAGQIAQLQERIDRVQAQLADSQNRATQQDRTITLLDSTVKSQHATLANNTSELMTMMQANSTLDHQVKDLKETRDQDRQTIGSLRERIAVLESASAIDATRIQVAEATAHWLVEENILLREALHTTGGDLKSIDTKMAERGRRKADRGE